MAALNNMGAYGAYLTGQQFEQEQQGARINQMNALVQLAQRQQQFNQNRELNPIEVLKQKAALETATLGNDKTRMDVNALNQLGGSDYLANQKRAESQKADAAHMMKFGEFVANNIETIKQTPVMARTQVWKDLLERSGFGMYANGVDKANPADLPANMDKVAKSAIQASKDFVLQRERLGSSEGIAQLQANTSRANNRENNQTSMRNTDARIGADMQMQGNRQSHELGMASVQAGYNAALEAQRQNGMSDRLLQQLGHNKEMLGAKANFDSLAEIQRAQTELEILGVKHTQALARAASEEEIQKRIIEYTAKIKQNFSVKSPSEFESWVNTSMKIWMGENPEASALDVLKAQQAYMATFLEMKEAKPTTTFNLGGGEITQTTQQPTLNRQGPVLNKENPPPEQSHPQLDQMTKMIMDSEKLDEAAAREKAKKVLGQ